MSESPFKVSEQTAPYSISKSPTFESSPVVDVSELRSHPELINLPIPSDQQIAIIKAALSGNNIKVQAFAGTGKTTTIQQISAVVKRDALYLAFNRAILEEIRSKLPSHVKAKTAHGIAWGAMVGPSELMREKLAGSKELWFNQNIAKFTGGKISKTLLAMVKKCVKNFMKSVDDEITEIHISVAHQLKIQKLTESNLDKLLGFLADLAQKHRDGSQSDHHKDIKAIYGIARQDSANKKLTIPVMLAKVLTENECQELIKQAIKNAANYSAIDPISYEDFPAKLYKKIVNHPATNSQQGNTTAQLTSGILSAAKNLWDNMTNPESECAIDHDGYLKLWQLSGPQINAEVIYVDEAQDLDPVMLDVLNKQNAQMIWLGDSYQQIYAWRGAVNALHHINNCAELELTETYRCAKSLVHYANAALKKLKEPREIVSNKIYETNSISKTAIIARTNATLFDSAFNMSDRNEKFVWTDRAFDPKKLINHCEDIIKVDDGIEPFMEIYKEFGSVKEIEISLEEEANDLIGRPLSLCKRFNFKLDKIQSALFKMQRSIDSNANTVLTTAHKSKGQEWDKVILCEDFYEAIERERRSDKNTTHEWNLLYVAVTRAKKELSMVDSILTLLGMGTANIIPAAQNTAATSL